MCPLIDARCLLGCRVVSKRQRREERSWRRVPPHPPQDIDQVRSHALMDRDRWTHPFLGKHFYPSMVRGGTRKGKEPTERERERVQTLRSVSEGRDD